MSKYRYALLLDNILPNEENVKLLQSILEANRDIIIFVGNKEQIIPCPFAVFNIVDFFNFEGVSIITSQYTLEKSIVYPVIGPKIIIGKIKYKDYINIPNLDFNLIEKVLDDRNKIAVS